MKKILILLFAATAVFLSPAPKASAGQSLSPQEVVELARNHPEIENAFNIPLVLSVRLVESKNGGTLIIQTGKNSFKCINFRGKAYKDEDGENGDDNTDDSPYYRWDSDYDGPLEEKTETELKIAVDRARESKDWDDINYAVGLLEQDDAWEGQDSIAEDLAGLLLLLIEDMPNAYDTFIDLLNFEITRPELVALSGELYCFTTYIKRTDPASKDRAIAFIQGLQEQEWASAEAKIATDIDDWLNSLQEDNH